MKNFISGLKRAQEGFTLVELMVVVGIIGILSSVAVPNFRRYQAKSKSSEAKLQLAALYAAENTMMMEFDNYATCFIQAGYVVPKSQNYYAVGFETDDAGLIADVVNNGGTFCVAAGHQHGATKIVAGKTAVVGELAEIDPPNDTFTNSIETMTVDPEGDQFTAGAIGYIDAVTIDAGGSVDADTDQWAIDEQKRVFHVAFGY